MSNTYTNKDRNAASIIRKVMDGLQFDHEGLCMMRTSSKSKYILNVAGTGKFNCEACTRSWNSSFSWITINLKAGKVQKWWKMKCIACRREVEPIFKDKSLIHMTTVAIQKYEGTYRRKARSNGVRPSPHSNVLCEKCGYNFYDHCYECILNN